MAALKMCLVCGALSKQSRCSIHRTNEARGYGTVHRRTRIEHLKQIPWCSHCGHVVGQDGYCGQMLCKKCPLELHHVAELQGGRSANVDGRRQLLCRKCHLNVKEV
jgi:hypothetical protein